MNDTSESSSAFFNNGDITIHNNAETKNDRNKIFNDTSSYFSVNYRGEKLQTNLASVNSSDKNCSEDLPYCDVNDDVDKKSEVKNQRNSETPIVSKFFNASDTYNFCECDYTIVQCTLENVSRADSDQIPVSEDVREFSLSQLETCDNSMPIPKFFNITPRDIPTSPHKVIEEEFKSNPWAMLVATIFLTKTTAKAAKPLMKQFFSEFSSPYDVINVDPYHIESFFETLGMRKRAQMIWRMSHEFVSAKWRRASDLYGIGKYGEDAYRLFCLGHTDIEPTDRYLRLYLDWLKSQTDHIESWSNIDSEDLIFDPIKEYYAISLK